jgi:hypothetical protein
MKKEIILTITKLALVAILVVSVATVQAQTNVSDPSLGNTMVKYVGTDLGMISFNLTFDNPGGKKFTVIILDEENYKLFQANYFDRKFNKEFKLPTQGTNRLTFIIMNSKAVYTSQTFKVETKVVEDVEVTKL